MTGKLESGAGRGVGGVVCVDEVNVDGILRKPFDKRVKVAVSKAVFDAAKADGVCRM